MREVDLVFVYCSSAMCWEPRCKTQPGFIQMNELAALWTPPKCPHCVSHTLHVRLSNSISNPLSFWWVNMLRPIIFSYVSETDKATIANTLRSNWQEALRCQSKARFGHLIQALFFFCILHTTICVTYCCAHQHECPQGETVQKCVSSSPERERGHIGSVMQE